MVGDECDKCVKSVKKHILDAKSWQPELDSGDYVVVVFNSSAAKGGINHPVSVDL